MFSLLAPPKETSLEKLGLAVDGKTILITGATYGIGEATALYLARAGAKVVLLARTKSKLEALQKTISTMAFIYPIDLSQLEAVKILMAQIQLEHPRIDILICNAGKSIRRRMTHSLEHNDLERLIALNFSSPSSLILALLPQMLEQGGAQIINVSTISARLTGIPMWAAYQSSKAGFDLWLRSLGNELRPQKILVSSLYMPLVRTRMSSAKQFANAPALSPLEAAQVIAYAIVHQPSRVAPWWLRLLELTTVLLENPTNWILTALFKWSTRQGND